VDGIRGGKSIVTWATTFRQRQHHLLLSCERDRPTAGLRCVAGGDGGGGASATPAPSRDGETASPRGIGRFAAGFIRAHAAKYRRRRACGLDVLPSPVVTTGGTAPRRSPSSPPSPAGDVLGGGARGAYLGLERVGERNARLLRFAQRHDTNAGTAVGPIPPQARRSPCRRLERSPSPPRSLRQRVGEPEPRLLHADRAQHWRRRCEARRPSGATVAPTGTAAPPSRRSRLGGRDRPRRPAPRPASPGSTASPAAARSRSPVRYRAWRRTRRRSQPAPVTSSPVTVQQPGRLSLSASATPAQVSAASATDSRSRSPYRTPAKRTWCWTRCPSPP